MNFRILRALLEIAMEVIMPKCLQCGAATSNPKFCNKSCAATYNNKKHPKRYLEGKCVVCGSPIKKRNKYCDSCNPFILDYSTITLGDVKAKRKYQPYSRIRDLSRRLYTRSGRPLKCVICGYENFVDICHKKAINSFSDSTAISTINHKDNLVALCPNHHKEFDNGLITL